MKHGVKDNSEVQYEAGKALPSSLAEVGSRLGEVVQAVGGRLKASAIAERSTDQITKYVKATAEPPFLALARLCMAAGRSMEWLATGVDVPVAAMGRISPSVHRDRETYTRATNVVSMAIGLARVTVEPAAVAQMVGDTYDKLLDQDFSGDRVLQVSNHLLEQLERIRKVQDAK